MSHAAALHSRDLALELHALLREIDPARWRDEVAEAARARLLSIEQRVSDLLESTWPDDTSRTLREQLSDIAAVVREQMPEEDVRGEWMVYRLELSTAYEQLARGLSEADVPVPSLRPTNYARNVLHVTSATVALLLVELVLPVGWLLPIAAGLAAMAWSFEISRRLSARVNAFMMWVFGPVAHPHEAHRINSSTWYTTALLGLALTGSPLVAALGLAVLGVGDPSAAVVGRRFGRIKLVHGRSLEGTVAFVGASLLAAGATLVAFHPGLGFVAMGVLAASAAIPGALAELFARRIDDNLAVPLAAAGGAWIAAAAMGLL